MTTPLEALVSVKLGSELLDQIHTALYWQGVQTGALWTALTLIIIYLLFHPHKDRS
jgi:hypothetical protein